MQSVPVETSDWWVELERWRGVLKSAVVDDGALSVTTCGVMLMLTWPVGSWAIVIQVLYNL